jgi:diguanylate cyclase
VCRIEGTLLKLNYLLLIVLMMAGCALQQTLLKLSEMGLNIAIDDYGTGYSSLAYLKKLPVQEWKIDKSFVLKVDQNKHDATIVRSTIDLGHNLNMRVVAEGVENQASWDLLNSMGFV